MPTRRTLTLAAVALAVATFGVAGAACSPAETVDAAAGRDRQGRPVILVGGCDPFRVRSVLVRDNVTGNGLELWRIDSTAVPHRIADEQTFVVGEAPDGFETRRSLERALPARPLQVKVDVAEAAGDELNRDAFVVVDMEALGPGQVVGDGGDVTPIGTWEGPTCSSFNGGVLAAGLGAGLGVALVGAVVVFFVLRRQLAAIDRAHPRR